MHHLGVIPPTHRLFDIEMASERQEVRTRLDAKMSKALIQKAVLCSDYSLCGDEEDTEWPAITPALPDLSLAVSCLTIHERKPKGSLALTKSARRPSRQLCSPARSSWGIHSTPAKKKSAANEMLTPPVTPGVERMVVYDMTQLDEDVMEIWYDA